MPQEFKEISHDYGLMFDSLSKRFSILKVVTNEKGEAVGEVLTIIC